jgi:hypothetical protein
VSSSTARFAGSHSTRTCCARRYGGADDDADAGALVEAPVDGGRTFVALPKRRGKLNVITMHAGEPYWAQVSIDGVPRGRTPLLLDLPIGRYQVRVERPGFRVQERRVLIAAGKLW